MPQVSIVKCDDYEPARVDQALSDVLSPLGGMGAFVSRGQRVLVKPNLLKKAGPDRAVTTHPALLAAVLRSVKACGPSEIVVADSPGGRSTESSARALFDASGIAKACADEGVPLELLDRSVTRVTAPGGRLYTSFNVGGRVAEADVLVNLPKLKTHGFMMLTCAVKNMFGCVPGLEKAQFHLKVPDRDDFGEMLVDLMLACSPALSIVDSVVGMEGEGPSGGTPRRIGALLASADCAALDVVAAAMAGFDPMEVYTNAAAHRRGMVPRDADDVEVVGVPWRHLAMDDFEKPAADVNGRLPAPLRKWLRKRTASRPTLDHPRTCTSCETCQRDCPVDAIAMVEGLPSFDYDRCIRCYCCQELCPVQAIGLATPSVVRALMYRGRDHKA